MVGSNQIANIEITLKPGTCNMQTLYNKKMTICKHIDIVQDDRGVSYTSATIGGQNFNHISKKIIGTNFLFDKSDLTKNDYTPGINCIDIDWNGLDLDGIEINYTSDLINYIQMLKNENLLLRDQLDSYSHIWDIDSINNFSDNFWIKASCEDELSEGNSHGDTIDYLCNEYCKYWDKTMKTTLATLSDGTALTCNRINYPISVTNKIKSLFNDTRNYETNATYVHPIEIYYVKNTQTDEIIKMSRRQFEHLTLLAAEYTPGILGNYYSSYQQYSDTNKDKQYTIEEIQENKIKYIKATNYLQLNKAIIKGFGKSENVNNVNYLTDINMTDITENKKYNVIYTVINKATGETQKMTRLEYNNLFASEKNNYTLVFNENRTCQYVYMDDINDSWFIQLTDSEYNKLTQAEKDNLLKFPLFDKEYPYNEYAYYTNDCVINPIVYTQDLSTLNTCSNTCLTLAIGYIWTKKEEYYDKLIDQLDTFFIISNTKMHPHFMYSQYHPGSFYSYNESYDKTINKTTFDYSSGQLIGQPGGLIDSQNLVDIVEAIKAVNKIKPINAAKYKKYKEWFAELSKFMYESTIGEKEPVIHNNNHATQYWLSVYLFSTFANVYSADYQYMIDSFCECVNAQIDDNGVMGEEMNRYNSLSYFVMNVRIILQMCKLIGKKQSIQKMPKIMKTMEKLNSFIGLTYSQYNDLGYTESNEQTYNSLIKESKILVNMYNKIFTSDSNIQPYVITDKYFYGANRKFVTR